MSTLTIYPLSSSHTPEKNQERAESQNGSLVGGFLEMINPLQHIPIVSHFYRNATGTDIPELAKIIGGGLTGGVIGAASSAAMSVAEGISGQPLLDSAQELLVSSPDYQPFAHSGQVVHALTPDEGQAYLALLESQSAQQQAIAASSMVQPTEEKKGLDALRTSAVGLPEEHIEAQMHHKLHEKTAALL
jgi:hypothetical protein